MNEAQKQFLRIIDEVESLPKAYELTGVSRKEFYSWLTNPEFARLVARSKIAAELLIEDALFVKSLQGDTTAIKLLLERRVERAPKAPSRIDRQLEILRNLNL